MHTLPETGFLRLIEIIGCEGLTEAQARANAEHNEQARKRATAEGRLDARGNPVFERRPTRARPAIPRLIPVSKSTWWTGVRSGRYPKPVRLGPRCTAWTVESVLALIAQTGK